jgi:erythromycin esterase
MRFVWVVLCGATATLAPLAPAHAQSASNDSPAVSAWLAANAMPLTTSLPGSGYADLSPLRDMLEGVRIVGLGESTHGTREFFQYKYRLLEFLVRELGYRLFVLEWSATAAEHVTGPYVLGEDVDSAAVSQSLAWVWDTEEVWEMLKWMRSYNLSVPPEQRVRFAGAEAFAFPQSQQSLLAYLEQVDPDQAAVADSLFTAAAALQDRLYGADTTVSAGAMREFAALRPGFHSLLGYLQLHENYLRTRWPAAEFDRALREARVIVQEADIYSRNMYGIPQGRPGRDFFLADNLRRRLEREPPGTKAVFWAHDGHIRKDSADAMAGYWLREWYGDAYYALGLMFNEGAFQAFERVPGGKMAEFRLGPAPEGSVEWYLAQPQLGDYLVDLRGAPMEGPVARWLMDSRELRVIGGSYSFDARDAVERRRVGNLFDGILFVQSTTRARMNPGRCQSRPGCK